MNANPMAFGALLLTAGWVADRFGPRTLLLGAAVAGLLGAATSATARHISGNAVRWANSAISSGTSGVLASACNSAVCGTKLLPRALPVLACASGATPLNTR